MKTIMITAIGGDIAQGVALAIREAKPDVRLIGVDMVTEHAGRHFVDEIRQVPSATSSEYISFIAELVAEYSIDVVIPISEAELETHLMVDDCQYGCAVVTCGRSVVRIGLDKLTTVNELKKLGLSVPWTVDSERSNPLEYPCIMKPRVGCGSKFVQPIENVNDLEFFRKKQPRCVLQEWLLPADQEVTCGVYRSLTGNIAVIQLRRKLVGGLTGWAEVVRSATIEHYCRVAAEGLDLRGSMNVQLRLTEDGPRIFEINPRFSSTVLMRAKFGFTDVVWALDELEGKEPTFPSVKVGQSIAKVQKVVILNK